MGHRPLVFGEEHDIQPTTVPARCGILTYLLSILSSLPRRCLQIVRIPSNTDTDSLSFENLQFLAGGKSGCVYAIDHRRVLKEFHESNRGEVERRAYQRLGSHLNIAKLLGVRKDGSIIIERGEVLRTVCRSPSADEIPFQTKLLWLRHAANGYQYLHTRNVVHGDVGCHNMILTKKNQVKIIDFEGCSIDGGPADACYEWFSYLPSPRVTRGTDIFAFGCVIYEVLTGQPLYHELEPSDDRSRQVRQLYTTKQFPDLKLLPLGRLIQACWQGDFSCMSEVIRELDKFRLFA